jgi:hypothetical protein
VQVEWCFDTSVTVSVRPDNAVLTATSDGRSNGPFFIDLETAASDQWTPAGTPTFDDDTVIEIRDRPTTAALRVRVGDMEQDRYWYDGEQHSAGEWHEVCDPDGDGLGDLVWFAAAGVLCILTVVGTIVWAIYSAVQERQASRRR